MCSYSVDVVDVESQNASALEVGRIHGLGVINSWRRQYLDIVAHGCRLRMGPGGVAPSHMGVGRIAPGLFFGAETSIDASHRYKSRKTNM